MAELPVIDLITPEFHQNPFKTYKVLREGMPLCQTVDGIYLVTRFDDVQTVMKRYKTFSSGWATSAVIHPEWVKKRLRRGPFMVETDPPVHTVHRGLIYPHLAKRKMINLGEQMKEFASELAERGISENNEFDFLDKFAFPYVVHFSDTATGLRSSENLQQTRDWVELSENIPVSRPSAAYLREKVQSELRKQNKYFDKMIQEKRSCPHSDMISTLVQTRINGKNISRKSLWGALNLFMISGFEAPGQIIATALMLLANNEKINRAVRDDFSLIPNLIEETVRLLSPAQGSFRVTTEEVELSGGVIPKGETILALIGSANRDPSQFEDPDEFRLGRHNMKSHIGWGGGNHLCIGVALAREEIKAAIEVLLQRYSKIQCKPWYEQVWFSTAIGWLVRKVPMQFSR